MKNNVVNFPKNEFEFNTKGVFIITIAALKDERSERVEKVVREFCNVICNKGFKEEPQTLFEKIVKMDMEEVKKWTESIYNKYINDNDVDEILESLD